jgi:ribosome biogenesis protein ENP2
MKQQYQTIRREKAEERKLEQKKSTPKCMVIKPGHKFEGFGASSQSDEPKRKKSAKASLGERIQSEDVDKIKTAPAGSREMTFTLKQSDRVIKAREQAKQHHEERRNIRRSASGLKSNRGRGRGFGRRH